jgi:hypothetical protein
VREAGGVDARVAGVRGGCEGEQRLLLRGEVDAVDGLQVVQRLDAEVVAGAEGTAFLAVPDDEGEHAPQAGQHLLAPVVVAGGDHLAVALGVEGGAVVAGQLLPQLDVVVDLAVEGQQVAPARVGERLVAEGHIDDREPLVGEHRVVADHLDAGLVGATVVEALQRSGDRVAMGARRAVRAEEGQDSAHGGHLFTCRPAAGRLPSESGGVAR